MPIIGLNFRSIEANVNENKIVKNVNVNSSPVIEKLEKRDINLPGVKEVISIDFKFTTKYETEIEEKKGGKKVDKIGEMVFKGTVLYNSDDIKEILKKWEKEKKIDDSIAVDVFNTIFRRCLTNAIALASELRLPPPIRFPFVKPKEQSEYIG